jgi:hypothetical protein
MLERISQLEETMNNGINQCNKCNDKCNDDNNNDDYRHNPFNFNAIYNYYDEQHYSEDDCPALDLISTHYADYFATVAEPVPLVPLEPVVPVVPEPVVAAPEEPYDDDDDMFELIQIEAVPNFDLPK